MKLLCAAAHWTPQQDFHLLATYNFRHKKIRGILEVTLEKGRPEQINMTTYMQRRLHRFSNRLTCRWASLKSR
jgi:hypothetical protein